jgi:hypothetical protein
MTSTYARDYINLPFEDTLRKYRRKNFMEKLEKYPHERFLEIGCGADPFFKYLNDVDLTVALEPDEVFFNIIKPIAENRTEIVLFNDVIENLAGDLNKHSFNYIVIAGFLQESKNPDLVLQKVSSLCNSDTLVYSYVPNARSFHRLLGKKMDIIEDIYQKSGHDIMLDKKIVFDNESFTDLFTRNNFKVIESGSYFVKPFTHQQMLGLLEHKIIDDTCLDGLYNMIDLLPDMGAELWNICKFND